MELIAVMAKYNPFAEKAGMHKICEQPPAKEAVKIADLLRKLGFNIWLLGSETYVSNKLKSLSPDEIEAIKEVFIKNYHIRFKKSFHGEMPFGKKKHFIKKIKEANPEKLTHLIKICGLLLQSKVYLFWAK